MALGTHQRRCIAPAAPSPCAMTPKRGKSEPNVAEGKGMALGTHQRRRDACGPSASGVTERGKSEPK
jgi:hypothetical protein